MKREGANIKVGQKNTATAQAKRMTCVRALWNGNGTQKVSEYTPDSLATLMGYAGDAQPSNDTPESDNAIEDEALDPVGSFMLFLK